MTTRRILATSGGVLLDARPLADVTVGDVGSLVSARDRVGEWLVGDANRHARNSSAYFASSPKS